jgi:hypothetical protein
MKQLILISLSFFFLLNGCMEKLPGLYGSMKSLPLLLDNGSLVLKVVWNKSNDSIPDIVPLQNAKVTLSSHYGMQSYNTDADGYLKLNDLIIASYNISVTATSPLDPTIDLTGTIQALSITSDKICDTTIIVKAVYKLGITINEIYSAGPVNNLFYFYDQYIELYNSSDSVRYLDGMMVMRVSTNLNGIYFPGADWYNDGRMQGVTTIYKFPGKPGEKNHPFYPKEFLVLAGDAIDNRTIIPNSIDLSHADWEFYNQYMAADIDNPSVPNLINMRSDNATKFLVNLTYDIVALATGVDSVWTDGIDISTIIDAVQYNNNPGTTVKTIDNRLDRGIIQSPLRYSGQSMQRKVPGKDSNNGALDWEILANPTPGRQ